MNSAVPGVTTSPAFTWRCDTMPLNGACTLALSSIFCTFASWARAVLSCVCAFRLALRARSRSRSAMAPAFSSVSLRSRSRFAIS